MLGTNCSNSLFLQALNCQKPERAPIWLMRQAGRYMPQYRSLRQKYSFVELCHQPEVAAEVTLLPLDLLDVDAAILFSDILVILEAFNIPFHFEEGKGPIIERPLRTAADVDQLQMRPIAEALGYVSQAIGLILPQIKVPLIGFCGAPFTIASYLIEGGSSRDFKLTKQWMYNDPESFHRLLLKITDATIEYMQMQQEAGVQAIQIFDSWVHILSHSSFNQFSLRYLDRIVGKWRTFSRAVPLILFCRGSSVFVPELVHLRPSGISLDWNGDLSQIRLITPENIALQGNLDPDVLYSSKEVIQKEAEKILSSMKDDPGFIFNLGHGIKPDMPFDSVKALVDYVKSRKF
ncbi:MAG: hemE [Chlamydiales bacterium]|jgi:uroporphyrinogen decarboxylase|nr:hemE [Chlamydiales bacterium]